MLGRVALLDTTLTVVESTLTDHGGGFVLTAPGPGDYWIAADRIGYRPVIDGIIEIGEGGFLPIALFIRPQPVELEGLTATARRQRIVEKLDVSGFYRRLDQGFGHFVTPDDIRERPPADVPDLLRRVPGPRFDDRGVQGTALYFRARGLGGGDPNVPPGYCRPRIYVDGVLMTNAPRHPEDPVDVDPQSPGLEVSIEELVPVEDVVAVEVYPGAATAPLEWGGSQGNCGVVLFWTEGGG